MAGEGNGKDTPCGADARHLLPSDHGAYLLLGPYWPRPTYPAPRWQSGKAAMQSRAMTVTLGTRGNKRHRLFRLQGVAMCRKGCGAVWGGVAMALGCIQTQTTFFSFFFFVFFVSSGGGSICSTSSELCSRELLEYIKNGHMRCCFSKGKGGGQGTPAAGA